MTEPTSPEVSDATAAIDGAEAAAPGGGLRLRAGFGLDASVLFVLILGFYHVNGSFTLANDVTGNLSIPISLLNEGNLTFTPDEFPNMFNWQFEAEDVYEPATFRFWEDEIWGEAASRRLEKGQLHFAGPQYFLVESVREGEYVNDYGVGAGLTALPVFAVLHGVLGDLRLYPSLTYHAGKLVAAACVAGSAVFLFALASLYVSRNSALLVAMTYALGTGVWSTSSQSLWQHGPTALFLSMACYYLVRSRELDRYAVYCGLAAGMAALCRPTSFTFELVVGVTLLATHRRRFFHFAAAAAAVGLVQGLYNHSHLGAFWAFGQTVDMADIAMMKTGSPDVWQFKILESATGLLLSPSRGLLVYSPVMAFAFAGILNAWNDDRYVALRPMSIVFALTALIQFSWYDWWGGWSYGTRPLVDTMIYLAVFLIPVMDWLWTRKTAAVIFFVTLAWSFFVQGLGAFASTGSRWNNRLVYQLEMKDGRGIQTFLDQDESQALLDSGTADLIGQAECDIDRPECRHRLWSLRDNQIAYYWRYFDKERGRKQYQSSSERIW